MKSFLSISCLVAAVVTAAWLHGPLQAQQGSAGGDSKTVSFADDTEAPAEAPTAAVGGRRKFSDRDARRLGITFLSTRAALKELKAAGSIDGTEGTGELAAIVANHISSKKENKAAYAKEGIDWDSLLSFIERLIELIMKLFAV